MTGCPQVSMCRAWRRRDFTSSNSPRKASRACQLALAQLGPQLVQAFVQVLEKVLPLVGSGRRLLAGRMVPAAAGLIADFDQLTGDMVQYVVKHQQADRVPVLKHGNASDAMAVHALQREGQLIIDVARVRGARHHLGYRKAGAIPSVAHDPQGQVPVCDHSHQTPRAMSRSVRMPTGCSCSSITTSEPTCSLSMRSAASWAEASGATVLGGARKRSGRAMWVTGLGVLVVSS